MWRIIRKIIRDGEGIRSWGIIRGCWLIRDSARTEGRYHFQMHCTSAVRLCLNISSHWAVADCRVATVGWNQACLSQGTRVGRLILRYIKEQPLMYVCLCLSVCVCVCVCVSAAGFACGRSLSFWCETTDFCPDARVEREVRVRFGHKCSFFNIKVIRLGSINLLRHPRSDASVQLKNF